MSYERRKTNPGKRERAAGKRHRRGAELIHGRWFKRGSRHFLRSLKIHLVVADAEKSGPERVKSLPADPARSFPL